MTVQHSPSNGATHFSGFPSSGLSTFTSVPGPPANPRAPLQHMYFFTFRFLVFFPIRRISTVPNNSNPPFDVIWPFRSFHLTIYVLLFLVNFIDFSHLVHVPLFPYCGSPVSFFQFCGSPVSFPFCGSFVSFLTVLWEFRLLLFRFLGVPSPFRFVGVPSPFSPFVGVPSPFPFCGSLVSFPFIGVSSPFRVLFLFLPTSHILYSISSPLSRFLVLMGGYC